MDMESVKHDLEVAEIFADATEDSEIHAARWRFNREFYETLARGHDNINVITDPAKGKGLTAAAAFSDGEVVLHEVALVASQTRDDIGVIPVCAKCLVSLESAAQVIHRNLGGAWAQRLTTIIPHAAVGRSKIPCAFSSLEEDSTDIDDDDDDRRRRKERNIAIRAEKCSVLYCSEKCRTQDASAHSVACVNRMNIESRRANKRFQSSVWHWRGVDYSDTLLCAWKIVAGCIAAARATGVDMRSTEESLERSFVPYEQLVKAPLDAFAFTFLLGGPGKDPKTRYDEYRAYRTAPWKHPLVARVAGIGGNDVLDLFLQGGLQAVHQMAHMSSLEANFFSPSRWSNLLGAVLLNGQERSPVSPWAELRAAVRAGRGDVDGSYDASTVHAFQRLWREMKADVGREKVEGLMGSSRGQAIYPLGCLFNHSCSPNVRVVYDDQGPCETLVAVATRDIAPGEELCISYIHEELTLWERQQQLAEHYLFDCRCSRCVEEFEATARDIPEVLVAPVELTSH